MTTTHVYDLIDTLMLLGESRPTANALVYLLEHKTATSRDLERHTDLQQPYVSLVMKDLTGRGWITSTDEKPIGKGRPTHIYALNVDIKQIIDYFESRALKEAEQSRETIERLKKIAQNGNGESA